jgi:eukaryotic-like serine/threonine-protein kinase
VILGEGATLADGRYTLVEHLGSGGMASVWLASDGTLGREVAIKVMSDMLAGDERWLRRFRREARAAAALQHPNIVKVFDFGLEDGRPYLIMAYVAGGSLKERLAAGSPVDGRALARELLGALAHVHAAGILHRDVKPGNILLDAEGASHLTDFGIARPSDATDMTQTGVVLGTMRYLAPEVAAGDPASERSDLYSAGCVLREVAAAELAPLVEALTADDPAARPMSADAALAQLPDDTAPTAATVADGETAPTAPTAVIPRQPRLEPAAQWHAARRSPWFAPVAALGAIVVVAIVVVVLATGGGDGSGAPPRVAPSYAPLQQQLDQLDRAIDAAR